MPIDDEYFKNNNPIATAHFDGSEASFDITTGNLSANKELSAYGCPKIRYMLDW